MEIRTLKEVQQIIQLGKSEGFLTLDEVNRLLPADTISAEEIDDVLALLGALEIELVDDPAPPGDDSEDGLDEEPLALAEGDEMPRAAVAVVAPRQPARSAPADPVRSTSTRWGAFPLLGREGEVELARRIEEASDQVRNEAFASPLALAYVLDLAARLEAGEIDLADVVGDADDELRERRRRRRRARDPLRAGRRRASSGCERSAPPGARARATRERVDGDDGARARPAPLCRDRRLDSLGGGRGDALSGGAPSRGGALRR